MQCLSSLECRPMHVSSLCCHITRNALGTIVSCVAPCDAKSVWVSMMEFTLFNFHDDTLLSISLRSHCAMAIIDHVR